LRERDEIIDRKTHDDSRHAQKSADSLEIVISRMSGSRNVMRAADIRARQEIRRAFLVEEALEQDAVG
jgi:hypothetical protein